MPITRTQNVAEYHSQTKVKRYFIYLVFISTMCFILYVFATHHMIDINPLNFIKEKYLSIMKPTVSTSSKPNTWQNINYKAENARTNIYIDS